MESPRMRILLCLGAMAIVLSFQAGWAEVRITEPTVRPYCAAAVRVKLGEHVIELPRVPGLYLQHNGRRIQPPPPCETSVAPLVEATRASVTPCKVSSTSPEGEVWLQLTFDLLHGARRNDEYAEIVARLKEEGKVLEDLPMSGPFYMVDDFTFVASDGPLVTPGGHPLVFSFCDPHGSAFDCDVSFMWDEELRVILRSSRHHDASMEAWHDVYPEVISYLSKIILRF
jgi:hypothetical protein